MRQRNSGDYPLVVHTDPPQTVDPGEVVDWPDPIIGLTPVPADPELEAPVKVARTSKEATR